MKQSIYQILRQYAKEDRTTNKEKKQIANTKKKNDCQNTQNKIDKVKRISNRKQKSQTYKDKWIH